MDYLWFALCWVGYFILHSVLAVVSVKNYFYSVGSKPRTYRLIYNLIAIITLIPLVIFASSIGPHFVFEPGKISMFGGLILAGWGFVIAKVAFKSYDAKAFLGLGDLKTEDEFTTEGLLKTVRHPLYSGSILMITGYFLFDPKLSTLVSVSMIILYFLVGIHLEEKKLIRAFGRKYLEYKKKTPMLMPRFWKNSK